MNVVGTKTFQFKFCHIHRHSVGYKERHVHKTSEMGYWGGGIHWAGSALWSDAVPRERLSCVLSVGNNLVVGGMSTFVLKGDLSVVA